MAGTVYYVETGASANGGGGRGGGGGAGNELYRYRIADRRPTGERGTQLFAERRRGQADGGQH